MKSNIEAHADEVTKIDKSAFTLLSNDPPRAGKLFRLLMPHEEGSAETIFIGFAGAAGDIYAFNFGVGGYLPLEMIMEELQKKQGIIFQKDKISYAYLKEALVKSIPGHLQIISEMEAILKDEGSGNL